MVQSNAAKKKGFLWGSGLPFYISKDEDGYPYNKRIVICAKTLLFKLAFGLECFWDWTAQEIETTVITSVIWFVLNKSCNM